MKDMKRKKYHSSAFAIVLTMLLSLVTICDLRAQNEVVVTTQLAPPISPYIPQLAADVQGSQYNTLASKLSIQLRNTTSSQVKVKLGWEIKRISPSPMLSVSLKEEFSPANPIILDAYEFKALDKSTLDFSFGNVSRSQIELKGFQISDLVENGVNYKLPEGTYQICVTAYDYDFYGHTKAMSPMGSGCITFDICYTISAPQFTFPFSTIMGADRSFPDYNPISKQISFDWTMPSSTCGLPINNLRYNFEIREVFPGQAINDALLNPPVFMQSDLQRNNFILDTLLYPYVLRHGSKYVVRVQAKINPDPTGTIELANQ
ncbi:MAG: hypothetical protein J5I91_04440 [Bacteroidetes bacterium]|nr:hypothetical protein [Bacteroidota bacterium]